MLDFIILISILKSTVTSSEQVSNSCVPVPSFSYRSFNPSWVESTNSLFKNNKPINVAFDFDDTLVTTISMASGSQWIKTKVTLKNMLLYHHQHKNKLFVITGRSLSDYKVVEGYFKRNYSEEVFNKIEFRYTGDSILTKSYFLNLYKIDIYYGDSDSDIINALISGSLPIRVVKHEATIDQSVMNIGKYGEYVLSCSQLTE